MREVVYYDCNASVRALLTEKLKNLGFSVVLPQRIDNIESDLRHCRHPALFIVDLSRRPDYLPILQSFVSNYIHDPSHCILTSVNPSALAHFLPGNINACFFKHVVERPFKTPEFLALIENECASNGSMTVSGVSLINSSVEQITDPHANVSLQEEEKDRVNEIVQSISRSISLAEVVNNAADNNRDKVPASAQIPAPTLAIPQSAADQANEVAPYKRHQTFRTLPINLDPLPPLPEISQPAPTNAVCTEQPAAAPSNQIQSRISRKHGASSASHPHAHTAPGVAVHESPSSSQSEPKRIPVRSAKATLDAIRGTSNGSHDSLPRVSSHAEHVSSISSERLESASSASSASFARQDRSFPQQAPEYAQPSAEEEEIISINLDIDDSLDSDSEPEHTMLISSENVESALKDLQPASKSTAISTGILSEYMWCDLLRRSFMSAERLTLEIGNSENNIVVIMEMGAVLWAEPCSPHSPCSAAEFLKTLPQALSLPIDNIRSLQNQGMDLANILVTLDIFDKLLPRLENFVLQTLDICINAPHNYTLFDGLSPNAEALLANRLALSLPVYPILFEQCRRSSVALGSIQYRKYRTRPDRTPLNASIRLNDQEKSLLDILTTPRTFNNLSKLVPGDISEPLSRLVLFDFVDIIF